MFRSISLHRMGDIIEIKLKDSSYKVYFKGKADINDPKAMKKLKDDLRQKGVPL